jgi:NADPH2:quinone reductase
MREIVMIKAVRIHQPGGPQAMVYEEIELAPPAPGEVQIRHHGIGLNFIDVYFRTGLYPGTYPLILGNEGAGEVIALGKGVKDFKIGDRVAYAPVPGAYCEARNIKADQLVKLAKNISYETAAAMMLKGLTAQYLLRQTYRVKAGTTLLIHAGAGGVGLILCQWAKALGATVIATVGSAEKAKLVKKFGAKHVILYGSENFVERVREITKGKMCDVVYDGVGKATFPASLDCLKPLGLFVSFGNASGPVDAFNLGLLSQKGSLFVTRPTLFTYTSQPGGLQKMAKDLMRMVSSGAVKIPIHASYPLQDVAQAHEALESRSTTGSTILIP